MTDFKPDEAGDDTEIIRATFRSVVQRGALIIAIICLFDSTMFYAIGDAQWWWGLSVSIGCLSIYYCLDPKRPFIIFIVALAAMIGATGWYCAHIALRYGSGINFHYKLIAIIPLIAVSGRMSIRMKWILILVSTAFLVMLDYRVSMTSTTLVLHPLIAALMRALNFGIPIVAMAALVLHYFKMVAQQQAQLKEHATTDPLTGLMNRRRLREIWMLASEGRRSSFPLSIILCDIDRFKAINDSYGHDVGDEVLRKVAQILPREVRNTDSVCRWGGEEFLLLLPRADNAQAVARANRIREIIAGTPLLIGDQTLNVTITMGVATLTDEEKFESAAHRADVALYEGKIAGRNRVIAAAAQYPGALSAT